MMELVIASTNLHKVREIRDILHTLEGVELLTLHDFPSYVQPEETGATIRENAELKALHAAKTLGKWVIADDSGLIVPAIRGEPGVYSARYAGPRATDADNRKKLLLRMKGLEKTDRVASFVCCIALAQPKGIEKTEEGLCEGTILSKDRGGNGFGYDTLFLKHDYNQTFAELPESKKNLVSHRRKALDRLYHTLEKICAKEAQNCATS